MTEKKFDLEDRLVDFAAHIVFLCKDLPSDMTGNLLWGPASKIRRKFRIKLWGSTRNKYN